MATSMQSKVRYPLSEKAKAAIISNEYRGVSVEEDGIYIYSRGFTLDHFLMRLSRDLQETYVAEHANSMERYDTWYLVHYENGTQRTIGIKREGQMSYDAVHDEPHTIEDCEKRQQELEASFKINTEDLPKHIPLPIGSGYRPR